MRSFKCTCGNDLFFDNSICICCKNEVGWCPQCKVVTDVTSDGNGGFSCPGCHSLLVKCTNYASYNVCNRFVIKPAGDSNSPEVAATVDQAENAGAQSAPVESAADVFCECCRFNRVIPDLSIEGNREKWYRLEAAKRRTLYDLDLVGLPYGNHADHVSPALVFDFKGDIIPDKKYRGMGTGQKVYTGHDNGVITINIQEADDIEREKLRVNMHEAHRSLLGHYRHEFGHYIWDVLVKGKDEPGSTAVFGDHTNPLYDVALQAYYQNGPRGDWLLNYVSAYATMHPWEDFAETFAVYLDMSSSLDTAIHQKLIPDLDYADLDAMVEAYKKLGVALNEMNRTIGLLDFLPEVFAKPIREKLRYIHRLTRNGAVQNGAQTNQSGLADQPADQAAGQPELAPV